MQKLVKWKHPHHMLHISYCKGTLTLGAQFEPLADQWRIKKNTTWGGDRDFKVLWFLLQKRKNDKDYYIVGNWIINGIHIVITERDFEVNGLYKIWKCKMEEGSGQSGTRSPDTTLNSPLQSEPLVDKISRPLISGYTLNL